MAIVEQNFNVTPLQMPCMRLMTVLMPMIMKITVDMHFMNAGANLKYKLLDLSDQTLG